MAEDAARETLRAEMVALLAARGHAAETGRAALGRLERAFAEEPALRSPELERMAGDLRLALEQGAGQRLGGKSAEAARLILRAIARELGPA